MQKYNRNNFLNTPALALLAIAFLLLVPVLVVSLSLNKVWIGAYWLMSALTWGMYAHDKRAAQKNNRRTPENVLHLFALICGWPGALSAQQFLRHKSQKQPFITILWVTIALNVAAFVGVIVL